MQDSTESTLWAARFNDEITPSGIVHDKHAKGDENGLPHRLSSSTEKPLASGSSTYFGRAIGGRYISLLHGNDTAQQALMTVLASDPNHRDPNVCKTPGGSNYSSQRTTPSKLVSPKGTVYEQISRYKIAPKACRKLVFTEESDAQTKTEQTRLMIYAPSGSAISKPSAAVNKKNSLPKKEQTFATLPTAELVFDEVLKGNLKSKKQQPSRSNVMGGAVKDFIRQVRDLPEVHSLLARLSAKTGVAMDALVFNWGHVLANALNGKNASNNLAAILEDANSAMMPVELLAKAFAHRYATHYFSKMELVPLSSGGYLPLAQSIKVRLTVEQLHIKRLIDVFKPHCRELPILRFLIPHLLTQSTQRLKQTTTLLQEPHISTLELTPKETKDAATVHTGSLPRP